MKKDNGKYKFEFPYNHGGISFEETAFEDLPLIDQVRLKPHLFEVVMKDTEGHMICEMGKDGKLKGFDIVEVLTNPTSTETSYKMNVGL